MKRFQIEIADNGYILHTERGPSVDDPLGQRGTKHMVFTDRVELMRAINYEIGHPGEFVCPEIDIVYATDRARSAA